MMPLRSDNQKVYAGAPILSERPKKFGWLLLAGICLGAILAAGYLYYQNTRLKQEFKNLSPAGPQAQISDYLERVSRLIILPENEEPTIAAISDTAPLKDQAFFTNAKTGDILLIYSQAKKAILYDPVSDKLVEVAPLNLDIEKKAE